MGRHSDPDRSSYYRSVAAAMSKGAVALLAVIVVVGGAIWFVNRQDDDLTELASPDNADVESDESVDLSDFHDEEPDPDGAEEDPDAEGGGANDDENADGNGEEDGNGTGEGDAEGEDPDGQDPEGDDLEGDDPEGDDPDGEAEGADEDENDAGPDPGSVRVQVLDGGVGPELTEAAAEFVRELGYEVPEVDTASCCYGETVVLFNEGQEEAANGLFERDERFAGVEPNPNLTAEVEIHVIVGENWPQDDGEPDAEGEPEGEGEGEPEDPENTEDLDGLEDPEDG